MERETGGQAFPRQQWEYDGQNNVLQYQEEGMTLRDYLAASAMQQLVVHNHAEHDGIAKTCYHMADAMLKARAQQGVNDE